MSRFRDESHEDELEESVRRFPEQHTVDQGGFRDPEPPLFPEFNRPMFAALHGTAKPEEIPTEPAATDEGDDLFSRNVNRGFES